MYNVSVFILYVLILCVYEWLVLLAVLYSVVLGRDDIAVVANIQNFTVYTKLLLAH